MPNDSERRECVSCHRRRTAGNYFILSDGDTVCRDRRDCVWTCYSCSKSRGTNHVFTTVNNRKLCINCAPAGFAEARNCHECLTLFGDYENRYAVGELVWCRNCTSQWTHTYNCCNTRFDTRITTQGVVCDKCKSKYWQCIPCNAWYSKDYPCGRCGVNEDGTRPLCVCGSGTDSEPVHLYRCIPTLTFNGEGPLYFGVELEVQIKDSRLGREGASYARQALEPDLAILKHDSSIGGGFEIVTMPCSYEFYRKGAGRLWSAIDFVRTKYKGRSWDSESSSRTGGGSCGMHIHVSRSGFTDVAHQHRFIAFIYHNTEMMMKFSGRKNDYAKFDDAWVMDLYEKPHLSVQHKLNERGEKYSAVNTCHTDTFELRFFRGNMKIDGILANIGFAHAMVEYTRELPILMEYDVPDNNGSDTFKVIEFAHQWEKFIEYVLARGELYPELVDRLPKVKDINLRELEASSADEANEGGVSSVS